MPGEPGESWPEKRGAHATALIGANTSHTQVLISGGIKIPNFYDDIWLLDVTSMTWKKVR